MYGCTLQTVRGPSLMTRQPTRVAWLYGEGEGYFGKCTSCVFCLYPHLVLVLVYATVYAVVYVYVGKRITMYSISARLDISKGR